MSAAEQGGTTSVGQPQGADTSSTPPTIRVVRGKPTPVQIAALTAVLASAVAQTPDGGTGTRHPRTLWTARSRYARPRPSVGPGGWRASSLPR